MTQLIALLPNVLGQVGGDVEVHGLVADPQQVQPGDLFVAVPGVNADGHNSIIQAVMDGAVAVIGERPPQDLPDLPWGAFTYIRVNDAWKAWELLCEALQTRSGCGSSTGVRMDIEDGL